MDLIVGALLMVLVALYLVGVKEKYRGADYEVLGRVGLADALFFLQLHVCPRSIRAIQNTPPCLGWPFWPNGDRCTRR